MEEKNSFIKMLCPVCGKYMFVNSTDSEKTSPGYEDEETDYCTECGWVYDLSQSNDPDLRTGNNILSLNEYRLQYSEKIKENPKYNYMEATFSVKPHLCPVCGKHEFSSEGSWEVCPVCGWVDDYLMEQEPDKWAGNANDLCLNDYKKRYEILNKHM